MIEHGPTKRPYSMKREAAKIKIEFNDQAGAKYSFAVEGPSKENVVKIMDFIESMSGPVPQNQDFQEDDAPIDTNFARVYGLIETKFKFGSFNSNDVLEAYEHEFELPSTLSTISTYLARLTKRRLLTRSRNGAGWSYKLLRMEQKDTELVADQQLATNFISK